MNFIPLSGHIPSLKYLHHWERREKFMSYEDARRSWVIFAVEDGAFYFRIGSNEGTASFGDLVICPPGETFRRVVVSPITLYVINFIWEHDNGGELTAIDTRDVPSGKVSLHDTARLASTYRLMKQAFAPDDPWRKQKQTHYVYDLWLQVCEERKERVIPSIPATTSLNSDPATEEAARLIRLHAFQPILLQDIADSLNISLSQLSKKFKRRYGYTPIQYLTSYRLEKAKTLLLETRLTLDQISECCGYQNGFYLNRVFTKHMNITPSQFRDNHRI
jgi:AraC family transcriptional regulator